MTALTMNAPVAALRDSLRPAIWASVLGAALLVGACGTWAATTVIGGAIIAHGQVDVQGKPQHIQHLDGGIIAALAVRNGDRVAAGQVLLRLDPTLPQMNRDIALRRLVDALTLRARLESRQKALAEPVFTYPELLFALPDMTAEEDIQRRIFAARSAVLEGGRAQLAEKMLQIDEQIAGLRAQADAITQQLTFLDTDIVNKRALADRALARQSDLNDLQRARADMVGRKAALLSQIAQLANSRTDAELQTLQSERSFHETVATDLRDAIAQTEELALEVVSRQAQLDRVEVRAPVSGIVHEMQVTTIGGVVAPGAELMQIIPQDKAHDFELRIDPRSVDQVHPGQTAQVILAAFDPRDTPKLVGQVTRVSPNVVTDPQTGQRFYRVDLSVPETEIARLGAVEIVPGMPVEAYLETGDRSVLDYLVQPFVSQLRRAFRES